MKKRSTFTIPMLLGILLSIFIFTGCEKEELLIEDQNQNETEENITLKGGRLSWRFTSTSMPGDARNRITSAMNDAVRRYNSGGNWPSRTLTVEYNPKVRTADANRNGHIRFGPNSSYHNTRTAMHEISHTWGVGTTSKWRSLVKNRRYTGRNGVRQMQRFNGSNAEVKADKWHFWPYGLNYNNEWSGTNASRHVKMVWAMYRDGIY